MRALQVAGATQVESPPSSPLAELEAVYRANVAAIVSFFARRFADPYTVSDLTSEVFAQAIGSFGTFDPKRGSCRAWLFGIAHRILAQHLARMDSDRQAASRLASRRDLSSDEIDELLSRIDAQRAGRALVERCARLPVLERTAIDLVDLSGLTHQEAASALGVSRAALRVRLFRARARLRRGHDEKESRNGE
jgi:RNA polymerase sigma-70 factor (ECF subfamily)